MTATCDTCKLWGGAKPGIMRAPCNYPLPYFLGRLAIVDAKMTGCATHQPKDQPNDPR